MQTVVSITPIRVEADSRTFKQAASVARFGYRSIVVEGERSDFDSSELPFELCTIATRRSGNSTRNGLAIRENLDTRPRKARGLIHGLRQRLKSSPLGPPLLFAGFLADYWYRYCWLPLRYAPAASLYYLHAPYQFPAVYLLCKRHRAQFVYDAHDFYSELIDPGELTGAAERWTNKFLRGIEFLCARKAAAMVTVNHGIAALEQAAFGCTPIVLRNCHDHRLDRQPCRSLREELALSSETFLLVSVGQAKEGRAVPEALVALAALPERVHIAFIGANYEQYRDLIGQLGLKRRVHLVPPVRPYEVVPFVQSADAALILYFPRTAAYLHSLPNAFFQAIAAELPLCYPELPEIKRLAEEYTIGLPVDPQDPSSIRAAVLELLGNTERTLLYRRNLQRAKQELSWQREEVVLRQLLDRILA
jgi:glycosyltransferase involved in cell wall biosynthesis